MADQQPISDAWLAWITSSLLRNRSQDELVAVLVDQGLAEGRARALVRDVAASPALRAVEAAVGPVRRAALLRRSVLRNGSRRVCRISPDPQLYLDGFAAGQMPVVIEGFTHSWQSLDLTWQDLRERFGGETVTALTDRLRIDGNPDLEWEDHCTDMRFSDLLDQVLDPETGNDTYATARCKLSEGPLQPLMDELLFRSPILNENQGGTAFIVGPAGSETQLHFDISTTLLCQLLGRKRVWLVPPEEQVTSSRKYWADPVDLDDPDLAVREVVVQPGDALSIPAGWWHRTVAEEPCFTVTLANIQQANNHHDWLVER